ncbi:MAG: metal-dependent hydrolase family protein, partial [Verrucomicrobiales bacterium]
MKIIKTTITAAYLAGLMLAPLAGAQEEKKPSYTHITNVSIFDGLNEKTTEGSVLIGDNLIKEVGAAVKTPEGATVIDGAGMTLIPGLIDAHVHLSITEPVAVLRDQQDWMYWGA